MTMDSTYLLDGQVPPSINEEYLQVGAIQRRSFVAGPGERTTIWVAGCLRRCPGCIKPEFLSFTAGSRTSVTDLAARILETPGVTGVTYSGGEPFEQAHSLANLSRRVKAAGLTVLAYTGYTLDALHAEPRRFGPLLEQVDWLIDGEFQEEKLGPYRWYGSENQRVLQRRSDGTFFPIHSEEVREMQISIDGNGFRISGFPNQAIEQHLRTSLARRGILVSPAEVESDL